MDGFVNSTNDSVSVQGVTEKALDAMQVSGESKQVANVVAFECDELC